MAFVLFVLLQAAPGLNVNGVKSSVLPVYLLIVWRWPHEWYQKVAILIIFTTLAALEIGEMTTPGTTDDERIRKYVTKFWDVQINFEVSYDIS